MEAEDKKEKPAMDKGELRKKYEELTKQKLRASIAQREQEGQLDKLLEEAEGKSPKKLEEGPKTAPEPVPEPTPEKTPKKKVDPGDEAGGDDRMSDSSEESESENGMTPTTDILNQLVHNSRVTTNAISQLATNAGNPGGTYSYEGTLSKALEGAVKMLGRPPNFGGGKTEVHDFLDFKEQLYNILAYAEPKYAEAFKNLELLDDKDAIHCDICFT